MTNKIQQFSFIDLFIDLFECALHVSGDKFAHLQEHFLTVSLYTALVYNAPILLHTGGKVVTGLQQYRCIVPKVVYAVKKCS